MDHFYILDGREPVKEPDCVKWAHWMETADRTVMRTVLRGKVRVSTVFLGLNHGWNGAPVLFETCVFGGKHNGEIWRYETWEEAETGHASVVALMRGKKSEFSFSRS